MRHQSPAKRIICSPLGLRPYNITRRRDMLVFIYRISKFGFCMRLCIRVICQYGGMKYTKPYTTHSNYSRVVAADGVATTGTGRAAAADGGVDRAAQVEALARAARRELGDDLFFPFRARLRQREVVQWPEGRPEGLVFLGLHLIRHMHGAEHDVQLD